MKKLALITLVFITSFANAQHNMQSKQKMQDYTPEERAQLHSKQLTLDLDLSETQQKQVENLFLEMEKTRQTKIDKRKQSNTEKPSKASLSKEEKLKMKNERLDQQIEIKKHMKEILSEEQYSKWEKLREEKKGKYQKQMRQKKRASLKE